MQIPLNFSIVINANVETVWHKMLDLESYKIWTSVFGADSFYEGSWDLGGEIIFKADQPGGLAGKISAYEYLKSVEITYKGMVDKDGFIDESSKEFKSMQGLKERYTFSAISDNETKLEIYLETLEGFSEFMENQWPKALQNLKEICE